jgi:glutamate dehydrogenase/leucine dehydrogenase
VTSLLDREFGHERLQVFHDRETGVTGAIAIHSTALGPAMGGLRLYAYPGLEDAIVDVLRLSRAMSFKSAAAGLDLGGGKAVLIDDGRWGVGRGERMRSVGRAIEELSGRYVTAEDVGTTPHDMDAIAAVTGHVAGASPSLGGSGDPSPFTARTVFAAIEGAVRVRLGRDSIDGLRVGVQGVGNVGSALVRLLHGAGAEVAVTDADPARCAALAAELGVEALPPAGFSGGRFDVFSPCALGGVIGAAEVAGMAATVVAGAANNPLADRGAARALADRGVLYVPDFIANCGGIIHVGAEVLGLTEAAVEELLAASGGRSESILSEARETGRLPLEVAEEYSLRRIAAAERQMAGREAGGRDDRRRDIAAGRH